MYHTCVSTKHTVTYVGCANDCTRFVMLLSCARVLFLGAIAEHTTLAIGLRRQRSSVLPVPTYARGHDDAHGVQICVGEITPALPQGLGTDQIW